VDFLTDVPPTREVGAERVEFVGRRQAVLQ
jgi:hypothetical protein